MFLSRPLNLWHTRLGHVNFQYVCLLFSLLSNFYKTFKFYCEVCELSKHTHSSYIPRMHHYDNVLSIVHSDVWDASPIIALTDHRYYVTFIDDYSHCTWVYLLKRKSEVLFTFLQMIKI